MRRAPNKSLETTAVVASTLFASVCSVFMCPLSAVSQFVRRNASNLKPSSFNDHMKSVRLFFLAFSLLHVSTGIVGAGETNGFLVFEVERYTKGATSESKIQQKFKVPLTEEFMSFFKKSPSQSSSGTGFCCNGGNLKASEGSTRFIWWIRKTADNRWGITMWGEGVETIKGVTITSRNPKASQNVTIKKWEDLDMGYMLSYEGMGISFKAKYVTAKDIEADGHIPAAPVQKADHSELFKGDDLNSFPLEIRCLFQEG